MREPGAVAAAALLEVAHRHDRRDRRRDPTARARACPLEPVARQPLLLLPLSRRRDSPAQLAQDAFADELAQLDAAGDGGRAVNPKRSPVERAFAFAFASARLRAWTRPAEADVPWRSALAAESPPEKSCQGNGEEEEASGETSGSGGGGGDESRAWNKTAGPLAHPTKPEIKLLKR